MDLNISNDEIIYEINYVLKEYEEIKEQIKNVEI